MVIFAEEGVWCYEENEYFFCLCLCFFWGGVFSCVYPAKSIPVAGTVAAGDEVKAEHELVDAEKEVDVKIAAILAESDSEESYSTEPEVLVEGEESLSGEEQVLAEEQDDTDVGVGKPLDVGFKKTIMIPRLNRAITIDTSQMSIPGFGRVIFESVLDKKTKIELLRGRPEKETIGWGPVDIKNAVFTLNEATKDFTFKASISFLNREILQPTIESFSEDGKLLIKCLLPNPIWIPVSPWATFVIDAFYLEKDKGEGTLKVFTKAVLKQHPDVKIDIVFLKDQVAGTVIEGSLEQLLLSHIVAPIASTPFNKITLNKIKLRILSLTQPEKGQPVTKGTILEGVANFGGLLSSLPMKVDNLACNVVLGAPKAPFTLTAKIPESIDLIPSLVAVKEPTVVLQFAEQPEGESLTKQSLVKEEKEAVETVVDTGKKLHCNCWVRSNCHFPLLERLLLNWFQHSS